MICHIRISSPYCNYRLKSRKPYVFLHFSQDNPDDSQDPDRQRRLGAVRQTLAACDAGGYSLDGQTIRLSFIKDTGIDMFIMFFYRFFLVKFCSSCLFDRLFLVKFQETRGILQLCLNAMEHPSPRSHEH